MAEGVSNIVAVQDRGKTVTGPTLKVLLDSQSALRSVFGKDLTDSTLEAYVPQPESLDHNTGKTIMGETVVLSFNGASPNTLLTAQFTRAPRPSRPVGPGTDVSSIPCKSTSLIGMEAQSHSSTSISTLINTITQALPSRLSSRGWRMKKRGAPIVAGMRPSKGRKTFFSLSGTTRPNSRKGFPKSSPLGEVNEPDQSTHASLPLSPTPCGSTDSHSLSISFSSLSFGGAQ